MRSFRKAATLSQRDFASFMDTGKTYISQLELGIANPTFEILIYYAAFFGVEYYELGNPDFPVPTFDQLPAATRRAIHKLKKQQREAKEKAEVEKAANKEEGVPGRAKQLHALVASGFFKKPKTAKNAFLKLHPGITEKQLSDHTAEIGKITVTLSQGKFPKLLDKLEPAPGSTAVRFVEKAVGVVSVQSAPNGGISIAAEDS